jgi:hypothetical protein
MGRPRKPAAMHQAEGTYRKDRHAESAIITEPGALSIIPSERVPEAVRAEYSMTMRRLVDLGIIIDADVPLLEQAFGLLSDARYYHELMDRVKQNMDDLDSEELPEAVKMLVSLNSMHIKAATLYSTIISRFAITPSERAKILHALPKKKEDTTRKSIRSVIARKP